MPYFCLLMREGYCGHHGAVIHSGHSLQSFTPGGEHLIAPCDKGSLNTTANYLIVN